MLGRGFLSLLTYLINISWFWSHSQILFPIFEEASALKKWRNPTGGMEKVFVLAAMYINEGRGAEGDTED